MASFVLGIGQKQTLRNIVRLIESRIVKTEGAPRRISLWTDDYSIEVRRTQFKGDYEHYDLRIPKEDIDESSLKSLAAEYPNEFSLEEDTRLWHIVCPAETQSFSQRVLDALNKLSGMVHFPEIWRAEGFDFRIDPVNIEMLFHAMVQYHASDVHLTAGLSPVFRIDNDTRYSELMSPLSSMQILDLIKRIAPLEFWAEFENYKQTSFSYHQAGVGYARVSAFIKHGTPHCTFRYLPEKIPSFEDLNVPPEQMQSIAETPRGLIIVSGMTGSGKTTTMAALVDWINTHKSLHILTIENPIEYVHYNKKSIISQRSIGTDVGSFSEAVTGALRHDPDVILIGEMRDPDTIRAAINAAATGHLVITTLHSNTAYEVINRIVSFFDPIERDLVRLQLRDCLKGVICQRLVPKIGGGRLPALEFLFNDIKPIADAILKGDTDLIRIGMQQTVGHSMLFENYLYKMFKNGIIDLEKARSSCTDVSIFDQMRMGTYAVPRLDSIKGMA
ncbi:MAG: PilT/PilU family type 4a pilus ATPase [Candidatus Hydrogenedentes bacterium]|jgi:twitching motility protein PilT|nr:PilT/PilU family type 4a pilus ATPase [Candidatus Hydrogenedentota bacterium]